MSEAVTELLRAGLEHYLAGRLREAAGTWQEVLRLDPDNGRAREYLKSALGSHGSPRAGAEAAKRQQQPASTGWDDDRSVSVELDDGFAADEAPVPGHDTPRPHASAPAARDELEMLMRGARELYALNDFSGALELLEKVHAAEPGRAEAQRMREDCIETLTGMYESQLGPLTGVPEVVVLADEIIWLNLDHRAGFVLAQIDGGVSYDDLYAICGMSRLDTSKILAQLLQEKVIRTRR